MSVKHNNDGTVTITFTRAQYELLKEATSEYSEIYGTEQQDLDQDEDEWLEKASALSDLAVHVDGDPR